MASCLAVIDWTEARKVLDLCSDPGYFNMGLSTCLKKLMVVAPNETIKKLNIFKNEESHKKSLLVINLAKIIAAKDLPMALTLVESLKGNAQYPQGLVEIALLIHPADPGKSHRLIEQAFDYLEGHDQAFDRWSNFGGRPVLAAQIVYHARKVDYPDPKALIARAMGCLGGTGVDGPEERKRQGLLTAYALAFSDPDTAKKLVEMYSSNDDLALEWTKGGRRSQGFLLALVDPKKTMRTFDEMGSTGWNSKKVSQLGLSELLDSFTKSGDLMAHMNEWESLMWRSLERD